ncbi:anti-sigma factor domain-containing protein [Lederbergia citri]|uniref:Anti-sigma factor n=1 Tax=Lederbergia citri TaxID=2833580 RepID=A0A942THG0_9BACI|nr:anti-sigma factor [Lederbergia citri]MBS4196169.1 anti-sigma factor [Lederbergia citri]
MSCPHWTDEQMIDFILGKSSEEHRVAIQKSITGCEECHANYLVWKDTLPHEELLEPSKLLKKRVMNSYRSNTKEKLRFRPSLFWKVSSIAVIGMALLFVVLFDVFPKQSTDPITDHSMFVMNDDTDIYELQPQMSQPTPTKGYAWINNRTKEVYLFVDGLPPLENKDYQAWVKTYNGLYDAGIIQLLGERGQLYRKSEQLERIEYIIVSVEPKGGSRVPTEEYLQVIKVKAKKSDY